MTSVPSSRAPNDPTFRVYSAEQAEQYATHRPGYPTHVIKFIVDHHRATGGQTGVLLDLGCGPGNSTRDLSPYFDVVVGADAGAAMIKKAQEMGGTTATGAPVQFCECAAEEIDGISGLPYGSVDIITAVSAAHWFDMPKFWPAAAKVLKPGGTVAFLTINANYNHPANKNAAKLETINTHFVEHVLGPYAMPGNTIARAAYVGLGMPWDDASTAALFDREEFLRKEWDNESLLSDGETASNITYQATLTTIEKFTGTVSAVTRWREAHPDLAGTDQDCVKAVMAELREALDVSKDMDNTTTITIGAKATTIFVKRVV